jgi:hypothetical protein
MADAGHSKCFARKGVWVQVPHPAQLGFIAAGLRGSQSDDAERTAAEIAGLHHELRAEAEHG